MQCPGGSGSGRICFEGVHSAFGMHLCIPMVSSIAQYAGTYSILREMGYRPLSKECKSAFHYLPFMGMKTVQGLSGRHRAQVENDW